MFSLVIFAVIVFFILHNISQRLQPEIRNVFSRYVIFIFFLGALSITLYTADNLINHDQVDMDGDAQYYYYGAKEYLETGEINVYYPLYVKFISLFLPYGDAIAIRFSQLLLFILIYAIGSVILNDLGVSKNGYRYFSIFIGLNGAFYSIVAVIVRDIFILLHLVVLVFLLSRLMVLYDQGKLNHKKLILYSVLSFVVGFGLNELQFVSLYVMLTAFLFYWVIMVVLLKRQVHRKMALLFTVLCVSLVLIKFILPAEAFLNAYQAAVVDKLIIQEQIELAGEKPIETNPLFSFLRFILGPGLIRPLFPEEYFIVYTAMFALFNLWGAFSWYVNLAVTVPALIRSPLVFLKKPPAPFVLAFFIGYAFMYAIAGGGPGGLRKRAIVYFFYTLFIAITFFTTYKGKKIQDLKIIYKGIKLPYLILISAVVLILIFVQARGL